MKQYIITRQDLKLPKGKLAGQCCHASIGASRQLPNHMVERWLENNLQTKIILKVKNLVELFELYNLCELDNLHPYLVVNFAKDKWHNNITCFGVGPHEDYRFDKIFDNIKLL